MNLIIIGNGFDLAHGLKTSYRHFLADLNKKIHANPGNYLNLVNTSTSNSGYKLVEKSVNSKMTIYRNDFLRLLYSLSSEKQNWSDIEYLYFKLLTSHFDNDYTNKNFKVEKIYKNPTKLNEDFASIKTHLEKYLLEEQERFIEIEALNYFLSKFNSKDTTILNFNYTNTVRKYLNSSKITDLVHIHGELNSTENPMIFGFAANDVESKKLIDQEDNEFMINIKKINYKLTDNEPRLKQKLDDSELIDVYILGHSCGISDKHILNQIFNHQNVKSIVIFYFNGDEGYTQSTININRIIDDYSKDRQEIPAFPKFFNKPFCSPFIQHDSSDSEISDFKKFIDVRIKSYNERLESLNNKYIKHL
jgi:hypothetical protein